MSETKISRDGDYITVSATCIITGNVSVVKYPKIEYDKFMKGKKDNIDPIDKLFLTKKISPAGYKLFVPKNEEEYYDYKNI